MITQKQLEEVRRVLLPLITESYIKTVWISGYEESSDTLKVNVLVDDTANGEQAVRNARSTLANLSVNASKFGVIFMPLRKLSKFLELLKHGDQLTMSTLSNVILLHDPCGYIKALNGLMRKGKIYGTEERSLKLFEKAKEKLYRASQIVYSEIPLEAYNAMIESAHAALLYAEKHPTANKGIENELIKCYGSWLDQARINDLKDAHIIAERIQKEPKAYTSEEIEKLVKSSKNFVRHMQDTVAKFETESDEKFIEDTFKHSVKRCSELLNIPITSDNDIVNSFRKRLVETGLISKHHIDTMLRLYEYSHAKHKDKLELSKSKFLDRNHLQGLKIALDELG